MTQTESKATLPQVMLFSKAARPQPLKNSGSGGVGGSGSGKLIPKTEASKPERIVSTHEDCRDYINKKLSEKVCKKTGRRYGKAPIYEVIEDDKALKKGDYIYEDTTHHEIELMKSDMKTHKGAIDPQTGEIYKEGVPGRNIKWLK